MDPALFKAATQGNITVLKQLLNHDRDLLMPRTPDGKTALHLAALHGHTDFACEILKVKEDLIVTRNADGDTPLHLAAREGKIRMVELLIYRYKQWPEHLTVEDAALQDPLILTNSAGNTPLHEAVGQGRGAVALTLFNAMPSCGHALNARMESPLHMAARDGLVLLVRRIVDMVWVHAKYIPCVLGTPLHQAVLGGHIRVVEILLQKLPELVELKDQNGNSALHYASHKDHERIAKLLLYQNMDQAYMGNDELQTPLHVAANYGSAKVVKVLISHCPAVIEKVDSDGRNAFHASTAIGKVNALKCLLRHVKDKALLNRVDNLGNTPLHIATMMRQTRSALLLLRERSVDPYVLNRQGKTARNIFELRTDEMDIYEMYLLEQLKRSESTRYEKQLLPPSVSMDRRRSQAPNHGEYFAHSIEIHLLIATLVATVTFAATFTMPGGYNQTDGTAIQGHFAAFKIFVISNTLAMCSSTVVLLSFLWAWQDPLKYKLDHLMWSHRLTFVACLAMLVALVSAVYVTVAPVVQWPAYVVIAMGAITPITVFLVLRKVLYIPL